MTAIEIVAELATAGGGVLRTADAVSAGVSKTALCRLANAGAIERIAHGQYILAHDMPDELYILQRRSDKIIFSHETALFLHDMAERTPFQHAVTIPSSDKLSPALASNCKVYYVKSDLHEIGKCLVSSKAGHDVAAYNAERTICDVLRSRNRIDSQTFAAALKNYAARKDQDWNRLREYADTFRITKLLRQYLEVLT